jgi:outer membrane protein OmpA-like peptidoglycan-associated protein
MAKLRVMGQRGFRSEEENLELSQRRVMVILEKLTQQESLETKVLKDEGFGEKHAFAPDTATEPELVKNRVVRVVRTQ